MDFTELSHHIIDQERQLTEIIENYQDGDELLVKAIFEGTIDLLRREGYGDTEIMYLIRDMIEKSLGIMIAIIDSEKGMIM